mmetsp:Transcript_58027/g.141805  ORF Transcript_58027/g.141805 Transcript_58027/m.141805 type:complete len:574 (+) Transcript_58027:211-1932(+)
MSSSTMNGGGAAGGGGLRRSSTSNGSYSDFASASNSAIVRTTENWLELFLTTSEKHNFGQWKEEIRDMSLVNYLTRPLWSYIARRFVPPTVAPNVLTLFGLGVLGQAWYVTYLYSTIYPRSCSWVAVIGIIAFFVLNSVVNAHAEHIRQRTALSELFKYACDSAATVFLSILTVYCLGFNDTTQHDTEIKWYVVQSAQLVLFLKHLSAFDRAAGLRYRILSGPGEVIFTAVSLLAIRATLGLEWMVAVYEYTVRTAVRVSHNSMGVSLSENMDYEQDVNRILGYGALQPIKYFYYTMYLIAVVRTLLLRPPHGWSRFGLSASLLMRLIPAVLYFQLGNDGGENGVDNNENAKTADVICDGLFMAVLTSDVTLAKMAGREVHPWVVLMSLAAISSHPVILALVMTYYVAVFGDLCAYLNMPLLTTCRNVYCDGIYDLCHIGHKLLFQNALQYGNRLFVGVVGDKDANNYKRPPIMTGSERCAEVEACKAVTKVIPNAPCFGLTKEFLDEHQIHVVAYGQEYLERYPDPKDDPYYRVPREMGIARPLPRTEGLSTSDLIRRIQAALPADQKKSPT